MISLVRRRNIDEDSFVRDNADMNFSGEVVEKKEEGIVLVKFIYEGIFNEILDKLGTMPLPPYIKEKLEDKERYQTVYAQPLGSMAAPTAGLHFTPELIEQVRAKGVDIAYVTLHVGLGTFRPVKADNILDHKMHTEHYSISKKTAEIINQTKETEKNYYKRVVIPQEHKETAEKILFKIESEFAYYDNEDMFSKKAIFECLEEIVKSCGVEIKE